jgi:hypothetical protein
MPQRAERTVDRTDKDTAKAPYDPYEELNKDSTLAEGGVDEGTGDGGAPMPDPKTGGGGAGASTKV